MSDAEPLVTVADLAGRPDFTLGEARISPATRTVRGPGGEMIVEPRVMQVLVVLADAGGKVVLRETLFNRCWGSAYVGDDSLNRAIAGVRRLAKDIANESFAVETVPRMGYRIAVERDVGDEDNSSAAGMAARPVVSRRTVVGGAAAGAVTLAAGAGLWTVSSRKTRDFDRLIELAEQELAFGDPATDGVRHLEQAIRLDPDNPKALGLYAYAQATRAESASANAPANALPLAERAARAALAADPDEPNARLAAVLAQRSLLDIATTEDRLRAILEIDPANIYVMRQLWNLLQSAGRSRDALALVDRALTVNPAAAMSNFPRAQLLWILGRVAEADRVIDRAMLYWPSHRFVRFARFTIWAFTGRHEAALAMLEDERTRPQIYTPEAVALWRVSLKAFADKSAASIEAARTANMEAASRKLALSSQAVLALSALGQVDDAFEVANNLLLFRFPIGPGSEVERQRRVRSTGWRFVPWLFTPPVASMRADPRFKALCDGIGLTDYWTKRGITPDHRLGTL